MAVGAAIDVANLCLGAFLNIALACFQFTRVDCVSRFVSHVYMHACHGGLVRTMRLIELGFIS